MEKAKRYQDKKVRIFLNSGTINAQKYQQVVCILTSMEFDIFGVKHIFILDYFSILNAGFDIFNFMLMFSHIWGK